MVDPHVCTNKNTKMVFVVTEQGINISQKEKQSAKHCLVMKYMIVYY